MTTRRRSPSTALEQNPTPDDPLAQRATPNTGQNDDPRGDDASTADNDTGGAARRAFEGLAAFLQARAGRPTEAINRDVGLVVSRVLAYEPRIVSLRPLVAEALPKHPLEPFDRLRPLALATWFCWIDARTGGAREARVRPLLDVATPLRRKLANVARSAVDFGLLPEAEVAEIEKQQGSRTQDLAHDLFAYPTLFFKYWERVKGRTPVTRELLDEAQASGLQLMALVATDSDDPTARPADSTPGDRLPAAWTALLEDWDACRRALAYLRWDDGDLDQWCPPLRTQEVKAAKPEGEKKPDAPDAKPDAAPAKDEKPA